jgi:hypothetical protein
MAQRDQNIPCPSDTFSGKLAAIEDRIFTEPWLRFWGIGAAEAWLLFLGWLFFFTGWLIRPDGKLGNIDFSWMWISGKFAAMADPSRIYNHEIYSAALNSYYHPLLTQYVYPPTYLFFTYPLSLLPYLIAFAAWVGATLLLYLMTVCLIVPRWTAVILALTPFAVLGNIGFGHNGFLTAGLIGLSLVFVERRPWVSGIFLGLLTYKPQFGVLFPLALLASRNWRALASAAAASVFLGIAAGIAFGFRSWPAFIASLFDRPSGLSPDARVVLRLQSTYGLAHWLGAGAWTAWSAHIVPAVVVAMAVWAVWVRPIPYPLKASLLCVGAVTVTPYVLAYDLCILAIAIAFFVEDGMARGFLPGERSTLAICWAGLIPLQVAPIGAIICIALLLLIGRRIMALRLIPVAA